MIFIVDQYPGLTDFPLTSCKGDVKAKGRASGMHLEIVAIIDRGHRDISRKHTD